MLNWEMVYNQPTAWYQMWAASEAVIPVWVDKPTMLAIPLDSLLMHDQAVFHFDDSVSESSSV